ncbi:DUF5655 domain-containing protein [Sinomonas halotolerans]|uniref:DUF5655 domain-containing protein n=1 Tax=Sinomonas halotolerans TaxID=1644133 RepID=A0ABU9X205_9MICC
MAEAARTWKGMIEMCQGLLVRKTGQDRAWWAARARAAGVLDDRALAEWMGSEHGVTGYARYAVSWEMFGYPEFMLRDADELFAGQYEDREHLRPIGEAILAWAGEADGVTVQMRKTYVSLHSPRRKFAQVAPATKSAVDVALRWEGPAPERLEPLRARPGDPFAWRIRLRSADEADEELFSLLAAARDQNS